MSEIISAERWDRDRRSLDDHYPGFRWVPINNAPASGEWQIPVSIIPKNAEIAAVLDELIGERPVGFSHSGRL